MKRLFQDHRRIWRLALGVLVAAASTTALPKEVSSNDSEMDRGDLQGRLLFPVEGAAREALVDTFRQLRGGRLHAALDILAPRNSAVMAVDDGTLVRLRFNRAGGTTIYQFDRTQTYCYYYAHLERYQVGIHEGMQVRRGETIGFVGTTGNADKKTPHLHFAISRLDRTKHWWSGRAINPYPLLK